MYSARCCGGASETAGGLGIDGKGDVIIAGGFSGVFDVGLGEIAARGKTDLFIAKFSRSE